MRPYVMLCVNILYDELFLNKTVPPDFSQGAI